MLPSGWDVSGARFVLDRRHSNRVCAVCQKRAASANRRGVQRSARAVSWASTDVCNGALPNTKALAFGILKTLCYARRAFRLFDDRSRRSACSTVVIQPVTRSVPEVRGERKPPGREGAGDIVMSIQLVCMDDGRTEGSSALG